MCIDIQSHFFFPHFASAKDQVALGVSSFGTDLTEKKKQTNKTKALPQPSNIIIINIHLM